MSDAFDPNAQTPPAAPPAMPPGWYDDGTGTQRYWDGAGWTDQATAGYASAVPAVGVSSDERTMAMLAHILGIFISFLGPLIIYLTKGNESAFVKHNAAEALNFAITVAIAWMVSFVLAFVLIGFLLMPVIWIGSIVLHIMGGIAANKGEWYRYPVNIRMVSGAAV